MKNITLSADERLIEEAREKARDESTTLNEQFRLWLEAYVGRQERIERARRTIDELQARISSGGRKFTRDEMNER
jgi:hypothetical protein